MVTAAHVWFLLHLDYFKLQRQCWLMHCNCNEELIFQLASNANDVLRVTMRVIVTGCDQYSCLWIGTTNLASLRRAEVSPILSPLIIFKDNPIYQILRWVLGLQRYFANYVCHWCIPPSSHLFMQSTRCQNLVDRVNPYFQRAWAPHC